MAARWTGTVLHLAGRAADGFAGRTECRWAGAARAGAGPALSNANQRRHRTGSEPPTILGERGWPTVPDEYQTGGRRNRTADYDDSELEAGKKERACPEINVSGVVAQHVSSMIARGRCASACRLACNWFSLDDVHFSPVFRSRSQPAFLMAISFSRLHRVPIATT